MSNTKNEGKGKTVAILGAITALIVAVTTLVTVLGDNNLLDWAGADETATALTAPTETEADVLTELFPTSTPIDTDIELPTPAAVTAEPEAVAATAPTCADYTAYANKAKNNAIVLGYTQDDFWVGLSDLPESAKAHGSLTGYIFDNSDAAQGCLRSWVKYLGAARTAHWPNGAGKGGRSTDEVWLSMSSPPLVGALAGWPTVPDMILVAVVDEAMNPDYVQVYACGADLPADALPHVAFWHAATSEAALDEYVALYENNGYALRDTVACQ